MREFKTIYLLFIIACVYDVSVFLLMCLQATGRLRA